MAMNPDDKLRKRVQWLNTQGGFNDALVKDKIMEAATGLEIARVMKILKDLEEKKEEVKDPTAYATSALRKAGGGGQGFGGGQQPPFSAPDWQSGGGGGAGFHSFSDSQAIPEEKNLQKRINWLNGAGGFQGGIVYDKIWEAAQGLEYAKVMQFLKQMEEKGPEQVRDPTAWVCSALRKAGGGSPPGPPVPQGGGGFPPFGGSFAPPPMQPGGGSFVDADEKLRKRIEWMNSKGGFDGAFDHNKVAAAASGLEIQVVMKVLKEAEEKKDTLKDPTAYVSAALRKMGGGHGGHGGGGGGGFQQPAPQQFPAPGFPSVSQPWQGAGAGMDEDTKLRKKIGWLNNDGGFDGQIHYQKIFDSARGLEFDQVFFVLKQLEEKPRGSIRDPTGWVCAALRKAGGGDPAFNQPPGGSFGGGGGAGAGGFPSGGAAGAPMDVDMDQKLRKRIGWLNNHGGFEDAINYNKVAQAAEGCNLVDVMDILKELEEKKDIVKDPTAYASAALRKRKAASGCGGVRRTIQKRTHQ